MMDGVLTAVIMATLVEAVWETTKLIWDEGQINVDRIGAIFFGQVVAFGSQLDILKLIDVEMIPSWLGLVLTGILISRGANYIHDVFGIFKEHGNTL